MPAKKNELDMHYYLEIIQKYDSSLINHLVEVKEYYGFSRHFRIGLNIAAHNIGMLATDCDWLNRLRKLEVVKGKTIS